MNTASSRRVLALSLLLAFGCRAPASGTAEPLLADGVTADGGTAIAAPSDAAPAAAGEAEAQREVAPPAGREPTRAALRAEAGRVLDDWHDAAAVGDRNRYVDHFSPDAVFLGTDATERWDLATFTAYVDEHFRPGAGWAYTPSDRHVILGPDEKIAWFDEKLTSNKYGELRGTGALRRDGDTWRIAHYSMTFTVPNDVGSQVVQLVRAYFESKEGE